MCARSLRFIAFSVAALVASPAAAQVFNFWSWAECQGKSVEITFRGDDYGAYPEVVGYDIYRKTLPSCEINLVNLEPFPRTPGQQFSYTHSDTSVVREVMYEYEIVPVDSSRARHNPPEFCDLCDRWAWRSCPEHTAPVAHGTLTDGGWTMWVQRCPDSCYRYWYLESWPPELEQYMDTGIAVQLYGDAGCGSFEGCSISVTDFEVVPCSAAGVEAPEELVLAQPRLAVRPNPVIASAEFWVDVPGGLATVEIYDAAGRAVDAVPASTGMKIWSPPGDARSGVYFARLRHPHGAPVVKFLVIR